MSRRKNMPRLFDFAEAEKRLYEFWESRGYFKPEAAGPDAKPFVIAIPPPNITGELHQGHALFVTMEDLMIRYERMRGRAALWIPGTDHASIATHLQIEKQLEAEGLTRWDVGREEFLRRAWAWKEKYGNRIIEQLRSLGASCDWDRLCFTMDEARNRAVREAFVRLWEQGLIYRGKRLINWAPKLQTAVSDLEVEHSEEEGTLYYFYYPVDGEEKGIPVATTRPETILGDTAVAVHPDDERYKHLVGKTARVPILNRPIPIIADEYVDREFGTGALKVTPAHDPNDYDIARRHNLELINVLNLDATMNENAGPYAGLDRYECREKLWADMAEAGLTIKTEPYRHKVPRSQRGGEMIEPMLSTQWFVKIKPLAEKALAAVREGRIKIVPRRFEKIYFQWLENIEDWCISRQLWWGHRIPAWHCDDCGHITVARQDPDRCEKCGSPKIHQDEDVLDTWFSSALWPFSTLGWPDESTPDYQRYYPTDVMETGYDILFFWVARMIMTGIWFTGKEPFHTVYLHGLVRAGKEKMSKTKGNVSDPLDITSLYGTDSLRFTLATVSTPGNDMNLSNEKIEAARNFGNKIWQMARFITGNLDDEEPLGPPPRDGLTLPDRWIMSRLNRLIANVQRLFDNYLYGEAGRQIRDFLWDEFADWYIEISKIALYGDDESARRRTRHVLTHVLETTVRLLHPFMPFITEEIWQYLPHEGDALIMARWPESDLSWLDEQAESDMEMLMELIRGIRNVRAEYRVEPGLRIEAIITAPDGRTDVIYEHRSLFERLAGVDKLDVVTGLDTAPEYAATIAVGDVSCYVPLSDLIDLDAERERLNKELAELEAQIARTERLLANQNFVQKAKPEVVERERAKLEDLSARRRTLQERLSVLQRS